MTPPLTPPHNEVKTMLYRICKRLIERGQTAGLADKLDVFYAIGRITEAEYKELTQLLAQQEAAHGT
nr:MAG TPA: Short C-terminal domain [Bacteriophage sp.]